MFRGVQGEFKLPFDEKDKPPTDAESSLEAFNEWESKNPAKATNVETLFSTIKNRDSEIDAKKS